MPPLVRIPIARPDVGEAEAEAAARVIRSGWVAQGPEVEAFERELAQAVAAEHAVAVSSGTVALELSLRALGIGRGDDVVTVSHSFVATVNAVLAVGARPVLVDVEEETLGLDPKRLVEALTPRTRAIVCVHQLGIPCDLERIVEIGDAHGVPVVEDAACALGSEILWRGTRRRIGRPFGVVACFSFHPRKIITTGEGGMITASQSALAERLRLLRQHGSSAGVCQEPGFNARMTDIQAAIGRSQLARLDLALERRRALAERLSQALSQNRVLAPPSPERPGHRWNWQSYPARVRPGVSTSSAVCGFLAEKGIDARPGVSNAHREPAYAGRDFWTSAPGGLAVSERCQETIVLLPLFQGMSDAELVEVLEALRALEDR